MELIELIKKTPRSDSIAFNAIDLKKVIHDGNTIWSKGFDILYNLNNGVISGNKTFYTENDADYTLPAPTKTGYEFLGWTGSNGSTPQQKVSIPKGSTGNKTYTAEFARNIDVNIIAKNTSYELTALAPKIRAALDKQGVKYNDKSLHINSQVIENKFDINDTTPEKIYYEWNQFPDPNNYTLQGDAIINAIYAWNDYPALTRGSSKFNQLFIEDHSWEASDFEMSADYAWHGCGWSSGFIFHWDRKTDQAYKLDLGVKNNVVLKKVSGVTSYIGSQTHFDTIGTVLVQTTATIPIVGKGTNFTITMKGNNIQVKAGSKVIINYTDSSPIKTGGIGLWAGCTVAYRNVILNYFQVKEQPISEAAAEMTWRANAKHICVVVDKDTDTTFLNDTKTYNDFVNNKVYMDVWGSSTNQSAYENYYGKLGKDSNGVPYGKFYSQTNSVDNAAAQLAKYIEEII